MSIENEIERLVMAKGDLKAAINARGAALTDESISAYAEALNGLPTVVLQDKTAAPSAEEQTVTADEGYTGLSSVTVTAVPLDGLTVTPVAAAQTFSPDDGYLGYASVLVNGDANLVPSNIKNGVEIFGVTGILSGGAENQLIVCDVATDYKYVIAQEGEKITVEIALGTIDEGSTFKPTIKDVYGNTVECTYVQSGGTLSVSFTVTNSAVITVKEGEQLYYCTGVIKYASGRPVVGGTVTLKGTDINGEAVSLSTTTDENGVYYFRNLKYGTYTVTYKLSKNDAVLVPQD